MIGFERVPRGGGETRREAGRQVSATWSWSHRGGGAIWGRELQTPKAFHLVQCFCVAGTRLHWACFIRDLQLQHVGRATWHYRLEISFTYFAV